jgi:hypothetical protein
MRSGSSSLSVFDDGRFDVLLVGLPGLLFAIIVSYIAIGLGEGE